MLQIKWNFNNLLLQTRQLAYLHNCTVCICIVVYMHVCMCIMHALYQCIIIILSALCQYISAYICACGFYTLYSPLDIIQCQLIIAVNILLSSCITTYGRRQNKAYVLQLWYDYPTTTVCLKSMPDLCLVNHNYAMHCSIITVLTCYAQQNDYNTNMLCMQLQYQYAVHWRIDFSSILLLLCISKPRLVQASMSMRVANHTRTWTHMCKNGGYHYFKCLCPVLIGNSNAVLLYQHKYPMLKLQYPQCHVAVL